MTRETPRTSPKPFLLAEFPPPSLTEWQQAAIRRLEGTSFESSLTTSTLEGITLQPLYAAADRLDRPYLNTLPGTPPFARGSRTVGYRQKPWQIAQELPYPDHREFNRALRHDLAHGQTAVNLVLDEASRIGLDPDQAGKSQVGRGGTSLACLTELSEALAGLDLAATPLYVQAGTAALPFAIFLTAHCRRQGIDGATLRGSIAADPLGGLVSEGELPLSVAAAYDELALLNRWGRKEAPRLKTVMADGSPYHNGGANAVQELAFTLAAAVHHLRELQRRGLTVEDVAPRILCVFSVDSQFFLQIAKLRAARVLWSHAVAACEGSETAQKMTIHARSSDRSHSRLDPHVNILRGTTECLAALLGGCDSLHISPCDAQLGLPDEFSRRLARNTQLILREECHCDRVIDPAGGSWYVESLTAELAGKAWALFQEVEAAGGLAVALQQGLPQRLVAAAAAVRRDNVARSREVLVGVNKYPETAAQPRRSRWPDPSTFAAQRVADWQELHLSTSFTASESKMLNLHQAGQSTPEELFAAGVDAALHGATLGELTQFLRRDAGEKPRVKAIAVQRDAGSFEELHRTVLAWREQRQRDPQVFLANIGPVAEYMPRLDFTRSLFQTGGLAVTGEGWFPDADSALQAARGAGAPVVAIVAEDARYPEVVPILATALKQEPEPPLVIVAGPAGDNAELYLQAGVDGFIQSHNDALAFLQDLTRRIGVTS